MNTTDLRRLLDAMSAARYACVMAWEQHFVPGEDVVPIPEDCPRWKYAVDELRALQRHISRALVDKTPVKKG